MRPVQLLPHCVAAFVNKLPAGSVLDAVLDELLNGNLLPQLGLTPVPIARYSRCSGINSQRRHQQRSQCAICLSDVLALVDHVLSADLIP